MIKWFLPFTKERTQRGYNQEASWFYTSEGERGQMIPPDGVEQAEDNIAEVQDSYRYIRKSATAPTQGPFQVQFPILHHANIDI